MSKVAKKVQNPIISGYIQGFAKKYGISDSQAKDEHSLFEKYINDSILRVYGNDINSSFEEMETGTAFGIDGVAIFVNDKMVENVEDIEFACQGRRKIEVEFIFTQSKVSTKFNRDEVSDFLLGVYRFFNLEKCEIKELEAAWENTKYIYNMSDRFKNIPKISLFYVTLASQNIDLSDSHMKSSVETGLQNLKDKMMFDEEEITIEFMGLKEVMALHKKNSTNLEIKVNMEKQLVPYPKDPTGIIKSGYFGLINLKDLVVILTDDINNKNVLRRGIFEDNIRYYLGSNEKIEVNSNMKDQITGEKAHLFGLLNNGITIIADDINIVSTEVTLTNFQIVNGCQTSNVIFESLEEIKTENIYLPIRLISTEDEETKNSIIKATNSQTALKAEQLVALTPVQKAIEEFYSAKRNQNRFSLYYERRTEQYRDEEIQKTKIVNIPFQIKATSALFLDIPHEVSGQYGKVEQRTRGQLFQDTQFLNSYYVSGLLWYRVEAYVRNNEEGKKFRRARWHIMMLIKYMQCKIEDIDGMIGKKSEKISGVLEKKLLDDVESVKVIEEAIGIIKEYLLDISLDNEGIDDVLSDRKLFERKETTQGIIEFINNKQILPI